MIYVLTIGFYQLAFDSMRGLNTVIETLSKGMEVERDFTNGRSSWKKAGKGDPVKVELETDSTVSLTKGKKGYAPERVVVTPEVVCDELFGERSSPRQIAGSKCLPAFRNKAIRQ